MNALVHHDPERKDWEDTRQPATSVDASSRGAPHAAKRIIRFDDGAVRSVSLQRWGDTGEKAFDYIPFGGDILAEKRFGDFVLPVRLRVGWWHGTERFSPFFEAEIISAEPNDRGRSDRSQKEDQG